MKPYRRPLPRITLVVFYLLAFVLTLSAQEKPDCTVRVSLLQVNDVYQFAPVDQGKRGGLARLVTLREQIRKESPHTLFLMAGDTISPSVESITYKGAQMIDAWNAAGLDYATFGNHEFDLDRKSTRLNSSHSQISYAVFCLKKKNNEQRQVALHTTTSGN